MAVKWDSSDYRKNSSAQTAWALESLSALKLPEDATVLDIGCGDGHITAEIAHRAPKGKVVGIDASPAMIELAARSFPDVKNLRFAVMDACKIDLPERFDLAFSNATLHWIKKQDVFLSGLKKHMKSGGRLMFNCGGKGNAQDIIDVVRAVTALPVWSKYFPCDLTTPEKLPYAFLGPNEYVPLLEANGFRPERVELVPRQMKQAGKDGLRGWFRTTWMPITNFVPEDKRDAFIDDIIETYVEKHPLLADGSVMVGMSRLVVIASVL